MKRNVALISIGFGFLVAAGAIFEVVNLLDPTLIPAIQELPLMRIHHTERIVFWWTLASNCIAPFLGAALIALGIGMLRQRTWTLALSRINALVAVTLGLGSFIVCSIYLMPMALADWQAVDADQQRNGLVMLISIPSAAFGVAGFPTLAWLMNRRWARQHQLSIGNPAVTNPL